MLNLESNCLHLILKVTDTATVMVSSEDKQTPLTVPHLVSDEHGDDAADVSLLPQVPGGVSVSLLAVSLTPHCRLSRQGGQASRQTDPGVRVAGEVVHFWLQNSHCSHCSTAAATGLNTLNKTLQRRK